MTDNERQESISALRQLLAMCDFVDQYGDSIDADPYFNAVETAIESLNETRWIPVSERLPDERQDVYVTVLWDDYGDYITAYGMRTRFGWHLHSNAEGELIKDYTVIAWMPLPEPYREDGEA